MTKRANLGCAVILYVTVVRLASAQQAAPVLADFGMEPGTSDATTLDAGPLKLKGELGAAAALASGRTGKGLELAGKTEPAKLLSHWTIDNLTSAFTLSVWVKAESRPTGDIAVIVSKRPGWWSATPFVLGLDRDGRISASVNDGSDHWIHSDAAIETGKWTHIALTFEAGKQLTMYVGGVAQRERAGAGRLLGNTEPLHLGYVKGGDFPGGNYQPFKGTIDDLRLFPVALNEGQVKEESAGQLKTRPAETKDYPVRGIDPKEIPADVAKAPAADAPLVCEIVFDEQPKAKGMWFEARGNKPGIVDVDGQKTWARAANAGSAMGMPWGRSMKFVITDPRFKNGSMPAVDVEVEYLCKAWAPVEVAIDAKNGSRKAGSGWQASKWNTIRFSVDDAFFGQRDHGNPDMAMLSDGYDLRIVGYNEDVFIRRIRIIGHDRASQVDWTRMLRLSDITSTSETFVFPQGASHPLRYQLSNLALKDANLSWKWRLDDYSGKTLQQAGGTTMLSKETKGSIDVPVDTTNLPLGAYLIHMDVTVEKDGQPQKLFSRPGKVGVISSTQLAKARPGTDDFLYGVGGDWSPGLFEYYRLLGVDIVRSANVRLDNPDNAAIVKRHADAGLTIMPMCDPPQDGSPTKYHDGMNPESRRARLREQGERLTAWAKELAGKVKYYELGNEPDLRFFYHGPIEEYADSFKVMRSYIKKGDPNAIVMPGGLCFFGEGDARARKLISLLGKDDLDAWAYHGHGPGVGAERHAYERIRDEAAKAGDGREKLPYVETESGLAADWANPGELLLQGRTVIQKIVYTQSLNIPAFFWFSIRIDGGDAGYTMTEGINGREPRPAVLTYRNMVERLRHRKFVGMVDLKLPDTEAYLFQGQDNTTVLVAWSNRPAVHDVSIRLDSSDASLATVAQHDMFGNLQSLRLQPGGIANLFVGVDPVFLTWQGAGNAAAAVKVLEPMVGASIPSPVFAGVANQAVVTVRNTTTQTMLAQVNIEPHSRLPIRCEPKQIMAEVPAGQTRQYPVQLTVGESTAPLRLPRWWRVFPHVKADTDLSKLTAIPAALPGKTAEVRGTDVLSSDGKINITRVGGSSVEKDPAVLMTTITVPQDTTLKVGAGADWWMAWHVNGQRVFDTLSSGNNGATDRLKYSFELPLKAGANVIAVQVLSGSGGWALAFGGEKELSTLNSGGVAPDRLVCRLLIDGKQMTEQTMPLDVERPLLPGADPGTDLNAWQALEPVAVMDTLSVTNLHEKFPDSSKWYQGVNDLSATAWVAHGGETVTVAIAVRDDRHVDAPGGKLAEGDAVEVRLMDDAGKALLQGTLALAGGKMVAAGLPEGVIATAELKGDYILYRLTAPRTLAGTGPIRLLAKVLDNDAAYLKQFAQPKGRDGELGVRVMLK